MPVYAAISPTFSSTEASLEALNTASFYMDSANALKSSNRLKKANPATLARFEKVFVFMVDPRSSKGAAIYSFLIATAAFASCFILFLQTLDGPNHNSTYPDYPDLPNKGAYDISDKFFTVIFTIELVVRMIIWPSLWKEHEYLSERHLKPWLRDFFNWFDILAIIPFYSDRILGEEKSFVILRLCRLLRIFKLARNHSGTYILMRAIRASLAPISIALIFFMEIVLFFSVVMYMVDPNLDRNIAGFSDLLSSGYFVVVTVATIGYGDITPTKGNVASRLFAVMIIMSGTLFLSMPLAIIGTEFDRAWKEHAENVLRYQQQGSMIDIKEVASENNPDAKHEVLVKYNTPNKLYLRLAALVGEASLMIQTLVNETLGNNACALKLTEITEDVSQQLDICLLKSEELGGVVKEMIVGQVEKVVDKPDWKKWFHLTFTDPNSSRTAKWFNRWINFCLIFSMIIVVFQTMPDLQTYKESTHLCEKVVQRYCTKASDITYETDPGCFVAGTKTNEKLTFDCTKEEKQTNPSCYGYQYNFGNGTKNALSCQNFTIDEYAKLPTDPFGYTQVSPFRPINDLKIKERRLYVCNKWECHNEHVTFLEFGNFYVLVEYIFTLTYLVEFFGALFTCSDYKAFFKNPVVYIELLSFIPFFVFESNRFFYQIEPIYVITPGSQDVLTFLRLLRVFRIFKIQQSIPVTKVLWESISKTSTRLTIPYFMLVLVTTILSFIMFELEKGNECFYGQVCEILGKNVTFEPPELKGSPLNKRFLVNQKGNLSTFDDFFSAFWFVIVTLSTIGYGDMEPVSTSGKLVAVVAMLFGACYTAMPLTLVGSQFNKSYREHKRREALLRTKIEVSRPYEAPQSDIALWNSFLQNEHLHEIKRRLRNQLIPLLDSMAEDVVVDENKKAQLVVYVNELKDLIFDEKIALMQVGSIVNDLRKEGIRLAEQQTTALQSIS